MKKNDRLLDLIDRSLTGPIIEEDAFNNEHVSEGINRVLKDYDIKLNKDLIINMDNDLSDRVWSAQSIFWLPAVFIVKLQEG